MFWTIGLCIRNVIDWMSLCRRWRVKHLMLGRRNINTIGYWLRWLMGEHLQKNVLKIRHSSLTNISHTFDDPVMRDESRISSQIDCNLPSVKLRCRLVLPVWTSHHCAVVRIVCYLNYWMRSRGGQMVEPQGFVWRVSWRECHCWHCRHYRTPGHTEHSRQWWE